MMTSLVQRFQESQLLGRLLALVLVAVATFTVNFYKLGAWPFGLDEVPSLMELGILDTEHAQGGFKEQLKRLPQLVPTWYFAQRLFLQVFPADEFWTRVLSAVCGSLTVILVYVFARRWRGPWFAAALTLLVGLSQCFVWLVQQNRFYSMAMLFLAISLATVWSKSEKQLLFALLCAVSTVLAVLTHNLLAVVFWIGGIAAGMCLLLGFIPKAVGVRALLAAVVAFFTYLFYLRPLMTGWVSGGTGGTNGLVSFAAQLGIPTIALAAAGIAWSLRTLPKPDGLAWWFLVLLGGMAFVGLSPVLMGNWNARYALLFMFPFWVFAAYAVEQVAMRLEGSWHRIAWYACIVILLMPKLMSHFRDGERHDFRAAASSVAALMEGNETVYSNHPFTLEYYLRQYHSLKVERWNRATMGKRPSGFVVQATNAFTPLLRVPQCDSDLVAEIVTRRFDEQTHVIQIYRVTPR